jgi:predicted Rossmann fold nucleotide-binding protein DprA/Smf involved in DNA uptake
MASDQYLGWMALALTPGLGARMAGKLLRAMGSPEAIFSASLTELESHRLTAAVAQAIHSPQTHERRGEGTGSGAWCWNPPAHLGRAGIPARPARNL